jgi:acyl dehydratase
MYFEEFEVGQQFNTAGRTIAEADIVNFAGLSGDYNQIVDASSAPEVTFWYWPFVR